MPKYALFAPLAVIIVLVAGIAAVIASPAARPMVAGRLGAASAAPPSGPLVGSGFIEAEEIAMAAELGGRVVALAVEEGDEVAAGQLLLRLDTALLDAQIEGAQAALDLARAQLAQALAGARPEEVRVAEAALAQAEAARDGARQSWLDLQALRAEPQALDAEIARARAQVAAAEAALEEAVALKDAAEIAYDAFWEGRKQFDEAVRELVEIPEPYRPPLPGLPLEFHLIPSQYWQAWIGVNSAQARLDGARTALADLYSLRRDPQALNAQVDAAEARLRAAEAAVAQAEAALEALRAGPTPEQIRALEAQVGQAQAALNRLQVQHAKQTITAPRDGLVLAQSIRVGELAVPGATLLTLGDLDEVTLTVYVSEDQLGRLRIGQPVTVTVDSFPGRQFAGRLVVIADEAEFIPRNIEAQEERAAMVFAVDVHIPNPDHALKPGMPADALFSNAGKE